MFKCIVMKGFFVFVSIFSLKLSEGKMTNRKTNLGKSDLQEKQNRGKVTKFSTSDYIFSRLDFNPILFNPVPEKAMCNIFDKKWRFDKTTADT